MFNPSSKRRAQPLKRASLTLICQCPSTSKLNIYRKRTSEKATESEWNKNERVHKCADLARQKMDSFEKKKTNRT